MGPKNAKSLIWFQDDLDRAGHGNINTNVNANDKVNTNVKGLFKYKVSEFWAPCQEKSVLKNTPPLLMSYLKQR